MENNQNVSLANPRQPVFFETEIVDPNRTLEYIANSPIPEAAKQRVRRWLARWVALKGKFG